MGHYARFVHFIWGISEVSVPVLTDLCRPRGSAFDETSADAQQLANLLAHVALQRVMSNAGEPLFVSGAVAASSDGRPLANAIVDTWHSDDDGYYDVQRLEETGQFAMRGRFRTDENGRFHFWTIKPSAYPVPHDGPVGEMLAAKAAIRGGRRMCIS